MLGYIGSHYGLLVMAAGGLFMAVLGFVSIQDGLARRRGG